LSSFDLAGNTRLNWRNQARSIPSTDAVIIFTGTSVTTDMTNIQISNAGRFVYMELASAQAVVDTDTLITNTTSSAQACVVSNSGALDGKVVNLPSTILRIPAANEVAADADPFGLTASPITPTGLVVDPAVIAAAVGTALGAYDTNGVASRDDLADVGVDLTPVLDKLPESGRAATASEVSPTIDFSPTINPTVLSAGSISDIRSGLGTTAKQDEILAAVDAIDAGGLTPEESDTLNGIAAALGGAPVEPTGRIASGGRILAYVGDDFTVRSGTALPIPVSDPAGSLYTLLTSIGVDDLAFGASLPGKPAGLITGTIASITQSGSGANQLCNITIEISDCGVGLKLSEDYEWQIQSTQTHGDATDTLIRLEGMLSLRRNTVG
jgi:hypothetical protein